MILITVHRTKSIVPLSFPTSMHLLTLVHQQCWNRSTQKGVAEKASPQWRLLKVMYSFLPACKVQRTTITIHQPERFQRTSTIDVFWNSNHVKLVSFLKRRNMGPFSSNQKIFTNSKGATGHQIIIKTKVQCIVSWCSMCQKAQKQGRNSTSKAMSSITKKIQRLGDIHSSLVSILNNKILYLMWAIPFRRQMFV